MCEEGRFKSGCFPVSDRSTPTALVVEIHWARKVKKFDAYQPSSLLRESLKTFAPLGVVEKFDA
jgi:hypothetical protein